MVNGIDKKTMQGITYHNLPMYSLPIMRNQRVSGSISRVLLLGIHFLSLIGMSLQPMNISGLMA